MGVKGKVYIIGAGPGAPDLITVRGRRALEASDVIIADFLLPAGFLEELGVPTLGKRVIRLDPADHAQEKINRLLIEAACAGKTVARLKSGDALVFGRGAEEAAVLAREKIEWEIIPGLTSGIAAPALADLSLTCRGGGRSFAIATGRCAGGTINVQLPVADSVVLYMGVELLEELAERLKSQGWSADTPAIVIENASLPWEREVSGTLGTIANKAAAAFIAPPALLLVGEVARRRISQGRPTVLFTGLDPGSFRGLGRILHWPALQVERTANWQSLLASALERLAVGQFTHVVFTSKVGVAAFCEGLFALGHDVRVLNGVTIATAGAGTAQRLREYGICAEKVPDASGSPGIPAALGDCASSRVLLVQGTHAPRALEDELRYRGAEVRRLALHRVVPHPRLGQPLPEHDVIYFVSPSGVRAYWEAYGEVAFRRPIWSIGDATQRQIEAMGFRSEIVSPCALAAAERI